jgi:hypothetical protein
MRIRRIALRNFGGVEHSDVAFPVDGVTVIEGDNETGKSSLLRAIDAIIEYTDSSSSRKIKDLVPVGQDVGPEVEIEVETGDYAFRYRKRWIRDRLTELEITKPAHEQLTGRDAHDRVTQILGDTIDADLWKALRLDQGTALEQASFTGPALGRALDAAVGGDVAGEHEDALWDRVEAEYARYWTKTGKPKDDVASARREFDSAREEAEAARAHVRSLDEDSADVERLTAQTASLDKAAAEADVAVEELEEQVDKIAKIRRDLSSAVAERERAIAALGSARSERDRRTDQVEQLDVAMTALAKIEAEASGAEPERSLLRQEVADADKMAATARLAWKEAQRTYERARQDSEFRRWEIEVAQFHARRKRIEAAREELAEAAATIEAVGVDEELLGEIEAAYLRAVELRAAVERALPVVRIDAMRDLSVIIDGSDVDLIGGESTEITMHGRTEVVIPDTAGFTVTAGTDGADIVEELDQAEAAFTTLCERGGVSGFEEARTQSDQKTDAERTRTAALETVERDLADLTFEELVHKFDSLTRRIDTYLATRSDEPVLPLDHSSAQEVEVRAKQALSEAGELSERAADRAAAARDKLTELEKATAGREGKLEIANSAVSSARAVLIAARGERSDEAITRADLDATGAVKGAEQAVAGLEDRLRELDAGTLEALLVNALARRDRSRRDLDALVGRRRELEIRLALETERGPARAVDEAETRLVEAERRFEAIRRRADAAALLRGTFDTYRSAAHRRYIRPFRDEIERLGRIVFGGTLQVGLAEDLTIETRTLEGETLSFSQLSTGAQEQLGVLSRLACARLVSDDGGVPVVLDDALGWTDPERLDLMGAAISSTADDCQVIILTCVPDRYAAVGKARTVRV